MRVFFFDMDGTLIYRSTAMLQIAQVRGDRPFVESLEELYSAGSIDIPEFIRRVYRRWGLLTEEVLAAAFDAAPKLKGIAAVLEDISRRGGHTVLITMSIAPFAERFRECGFDRVYASEYPRDNRKSIHDCRLHTHTDKPAIAEQLCEELGASLGDAVALGDSRSDYELFQVVGTTVSVNGDAFLSGVSTLHFEGRDLQPIYNAIRHHISA